MSFSAGDPNNILTVPAGGTLQVFMEWSDPMAGSSNDYNLYLIDANDLSSILKKSQSVQTGTQNPFESFAYTNNTGSTKSVILNVEKKDSAAGRTVEIFTYGNSSMKYSSAGDALIGQEAVTGVMSVAAENAGAIGVAAYSSHGGSTIFTNFATQTSTVRQTLDGTAIDGVHTAIGAARGATIRSTAPAPPPHTRRRSRGSSSKSIRASRRRRSFRSWPTPRRTLPRTASAMTPPAAPGSTTRSMPRTKRTRPLRSIWPPPATRA